MKYLMKSFQRRKLLHLSAALSACFKSTPVAATQQAIWPVKPIRLVIPYAAGGGPDVLTRGILPLVIKELGQAIVPENKVGAGGAIAAEYVAQQAPDGYVWLLGGSTHVLQKIMQPGLRYNLQTDFTYASQLTSTPSVLMVSVTAPYQKIDDLLGEGVRKPGSLSYGSGGIGTAAHLTAATLMHHAGIQAVHIPYRGSVDLPRALTTGEIQFAIPTASTAIAMQASGRYRALAVTSAHRMAGFPGAVPLSDVAGTTELIQLSWSGIWLPAHVRPEVLRRVMEVMRAVFSMKEVEKTYLAQGTQVDLSKTPAEFAEFVHDETQKYKTIQQKLGLKTF